MSLWKTNSGQLLQRGKIALMSICDEVHNYVCQNEAQARNTGHFRCDSVTRSLVLEATMKVERVI